MKLKLTLFALACAATVAGCSTSSPYAGQEKEYGYVFKEGKTLTEAEVAKRDELLKDTFKLNIVSVVDTRTPEFLSPLEDESIIYDYDPADLLNGLESYVGSVMNRHTARGSDKSTQLYMEVGIHKFKTTVEHMWFNRYGKYVADIELDVLVRDDKSRVIYKDRIEMRRDMNRYSYKSAFPSDKQDRREMKALVKNVMDGLTVDLGWDLRQAFKKYRKYQKNKDKKGWFNF